MTWVVLCRIVTQAREHIHWGLTFEAGCGEGWDAPNMHVKGTACRGHSSLGRQAFSNHAGEIDLVLVTFQIWLEKQPG